MRYICFKSDAKIKPISAGHVVCSRFSTGAKQMTADAMLLLGYKGKVNITLQGDKYTLECGSFMIILPGDVHSISVEDFSEEQSYFSCFFVLPDDWVTMEADKVEDIDRKDLCVLPKYSKISNSEKYIVVFSQLIDELYNSLLNEPFKTEICDSYTKILLSSLADAALRYNGEGKKRISTEKIFHWLRFNAKRGITARDAAKALNYNADYLNQVIKSETGMTLTKYLNNLRINAAKTLLLNSDMPISQIAIEVGFSNEKYFMKIFKSYEKITPSQYRNTYLRGVY